MSSNFFCFRFDRNEREEIEEALEGKGEWGQLVVKVLVFLVLLSTFTFAIGTMEGINEDYEPLLNGVESFCVIVFTVEYMLRFWLAENKLEYVFKFIAIVDLLSILPSWIDLLIPGDAFPALQFLRMLRLFKFLMASDRGAKGVDAFAQSWKDNSSLIAAASFAGGAVWVVTASLQYYAEKDNEDMQWCYPKDGIPSKHCQCDDDSCEGSSCECVDRFSSIPSAMFYVLLNLSGEFPLADSHSTAGRVVAACTAVISVGIFAIPTGLVGAALEDSIGALNSGEEEDYDLDEHEAAEIAAETKKLLQEESSSSDFDVPAYTLSKSYKKTVGAVICLSAACSVLSTVPSVMSLCYMGFYAVDLTCAYFFFVEHLARIKSMGPQQALNSITADTFFFLVDLLSWFPTTIFLLGGWWACPPYVFLVVSFFRLLKYERYTHGFLILSKVTQKSGGVLAIGGAAAACCLVFSSALMYYAERNNPDPNMRKYYQSVPTAMWMTLLNLSGEAPLCDYTNAGRIIVGVLSFFAIPIFGIPIGALGAGFEGVIGELAADEDEESDESVLGERRSLLPDSMASQKSQQGYGATSRESPSTQFEKEASEEREFQQRRAAMTTPQRVVAGKGPSGRVFQATSIGATLFAVALEVISTCVFVQTSPVGMKVVEALELLVVLWFTTEYLLRVAANGNDYIFSWLGVVDFLATFPYFVAHGLLGPRLAVVVNVYDGPLRALRLLRLVRLDTYAPSLTLVDDAVRKCWPGLKLALYAGGSLWFCFNMLLFFVEHNDTDGGEEKRFRSALSSLQYSGILLTGDYPIKDFTVWGKLFCCCSVVVAVGIVSVPASVLANAFVELLQENADLEREKRRNAAIKMQKIFKSRRQQRLSAAGNAFANVVKDAHARSAELRGLDSRHNTIAHLCMWKNGPSATAKLYHSLIGVLILLNILAVILESIDLVASSVPHAVWQSFEAISVLFFTFEYLLDVLTARYDPKFNFSRYNKIVSFVGIADVCSIIPFYLETIVFPVLAPHVVFDSTIFRVLRLARIVELERFFQAFSLLDSVFSKSGPVLKATAVLAIIVWVGGATVFYYVEPHSSADGVAEKAARGGEDAAVFESIVDALYYVAIFLAGEWAVCDFTPLGALVSTLMAAIGVALFSIPVGVLFEGFQEMLEEKHAK